MHLLLIRHGETAHNAGRIALGRHDIPLNDRGLAGAQAIARTYGSGAHDISTIYSSPLQRARDTAAPLAARLGLDVLVEPDLIEMDIGELEEMSFPEVRERYPEFLGAWFSGQAPDARMPGGETLREVQERAWTAVSAAREAHPAGEVVAVTHNFVILTLICRAIALPLADFRRLRQALAAKTVIDVSERGAALLQLNDQSHLLGAGLATDLAPRDARP